MARVIRETLHHGNFRAVTDTPFVTLDADAVRRALMASPYAAGATPSARAVGEVWFGLTREGRGEWGWATYVLEDVPDVPVTIVRAVCMCGHTDTDPDQLETWNDYGVHPTVVTNNEDDHAVSVWTLSNGRVTIADNRTEEQK